MWGTYFSVGLLLFGIIFKKKGGAVPTPFSKKINKSYRIPKIPKKIDVPKETIGENHGDNSQDAIMDGSSDDDLTRKASDQAKGPFMSFYPNFTSILSYKVGF